MLLKLAKFIKSWQNPEPKGSGSAKERKLVNDNL